MAETEPLDETACRALLATEVVGRIGITGPRGPLVLPVNYRSVASDRGLAIVIRTRPGGVIDHALGRVAFEVDGIDRFRQRGWSVVAEGVMGRIGAVPDGAAIDPHAWITDHRDAWLVIDVDRLTGRRLVATVEWAFDATAYL